MITMLAKLVAQPGKEAEMRSAIEALVREVDAKEPGVLAYRMHEQDDAPGTFWMYEAYEDQAALDAHNTTDHMKAFATSMRTTAAARPQLIRITPVAAVTR